VLGPIQRRSDKRFKSGAKESGSISFNGLLMSFIWPLHIRTLVQLSKMSFPM
jgi:hypothetical protein